MFSLKIAITCLKIKIIRDALYKIFLSLNFIWGKFTLILEITHTICHAVDL